MLLPDARRGSCFGWSCSCARGADDEEAFVLTDRVVILGGGTAGWLTAAILAADHRADLPYGLSVTLIESPDVPILGVGEGTWPSMRDTLRRIGLSETAFVRRCGATFKQGSRFQGWRNGQEDDHYLHPFAAPPSEDDVDLLALWRADPSSSFAAAVSGQTIACERGLAPKQAATPEYAGVTNYAYHLDASAFAQMLKAHCTERLGVRFVPAHVEEAVARDDGGIAALRLRGGETLAGDVFVDCTGQAARLIEGHLGVRAIDQSRYLPNDSALALHVPYPSGDAPIASQTDATATPVGWVWDIGLQDRRGVGHVFASDYATEDEARALLSTYLRRHAPGAAVSAGDARLLRFRSAYRETPWQANCVAVGMAAGFVEPLEASAIVMVELAADALSASLPCRAEALPSLAARYNDRFAYRWARIVDFLKLHYVLSERSEPYWRDHRDPSSLPNRLAELMTRWRFAAPTREDFPQNREIFPAASYAYVLYGMGYHTDLPETKGRRADPAMLARVLEQGRQRAARYGAGLPAHRELIDHIKTRGLARA